MDANKNQFNLLKVTKFIRFEIFSYLSLRNISSLLFICKKLSEFVKEYFKQAHLNINENDLARFESSKYAKNLFQNVLNIDKLKIHAHNLCPRVFRFMPRRLQKLTLISCQPSLITDIDFFSNLTDRVANNLITFHLEFSTCESFFSSEQNSLLTESIGRFLDNCKKLESLKILQIENSKSYFANFFYYASFFLVKTLKKIDFKNIIIINDIGSLPRYIKKRVTELHNITLPNVLLASFNSNNVRKVTFHFDCDLQLLQTYFGINSSTIGFLSKCYQNLEKISITDKSFYESKHILEGPLRDLLISSPNIQNLTLNSYSVPFKISEFNLLCLFNQLSTLKHLSMSSCKSIGMNTIIELMKSNNRLTELILDYTEVNDYCLQIIADTLKEELTLISLRSCNKINIEGFRYFCSTVRSLKTFDVKWSSGFESEALQDLIKNCSKLQCLKLGDNIITDHDIKSIVLHLKDLTKLGLTHIDKNELVSANCFEFVDIMCDISLKQNLIFDKLVRLDLSQNSYISDKTVKDISRLFPNLEFINLSKCHRLTALALEHMCKSRLRYSLITINFSNISTFPGKFSIEQIKNYLVLFKKLVSLYLTRRLFSEELKEKCKNILILWVN